jgi:hypothetical protein
MSAKSAKMIRSAAALVTHHARATNSALAVQEIKAELAALGQVHTVAERALTQVDQLLALGDPKPGRLASLVATLKDVSTIMVNVRQEARAHIQARATQSESSTAPLPTDSPEE